MKSYIAVGALLAALASAQGITDLPACSLQCILTGVSAIGCSATDFSCSCKASDKLTATLQPCIQKACSAADQAKVISVLEGICSSVGVPITINTGAPASSTPPPASSAPASSAPPAMSSGSASGSAVYSSAAAPASSSSACTSSTVYTTVTATGSAPTYGSNGTITTGGVPAYTGAASANGVVFGAAGVFGLLAYIL